MDIEYIAPMIVAVVLILTAGGVAILRPLSKRLAELLEVMARTRQEPQIGEELRHVRDLLDTVSQRLTLLEERQDFSDQLIGRGRVEPRQIAHGSTTADPD